MSDEVAGSSQQEQAGKRLPVVVGVIGQLTPSRAPLLYAIDDAKVMAQVLQRETYGFELFVPPLFGEQAMTSAIKDTVLDLADALSSRFSGYIEVIPIGADLDDVYLVSHDSKAVCLQCDKDAQFFFRWVRHILFEHERAKNILIILDGCISQRRAVDVINLFNDMS